MTESQTTQKLLELRRVTRSVAEMIRGELTQYLGTLMPLMRPRTLLGHYVQGASKDAVRGSDRVFKDLQTAYEPVASSSPFNLPRDLKPPLPLESNALEFVPFEYPHAVKGRGSSKTVLMTSPLKWILFYEGYPPEKLREVVGKGDASGVHIQEHVLNHVALHVALQQKGVAQVFRDLRFPISTHHRSELGSLPISVISSAIPTVRPPDALIRESTELSGSDAFEEVVDTAAIQDLQDPLRERLLALIEGSAG